MRGYKRNPEGSNPRLPGFSIPIQALFIQLLSFCLTLFLLQVFTRLTDVDTNVLVFGITQGAMAAAISFFRRMRLWWLPIQFFFPLAMLLLLALQISPIWYLLAFFILLLLFWGAVVTRVPLYLSGHAVWEEVLALLPEDRPIRVIDVGSGLGGLALYLAEKRPLASVSGIEISPFLWMVSRVRQRLAKNSARFILGNYEKLPLTEYDVVFAYLSPIVMDALWLKAEAEMRPGALLLSFEFPVDETEADIQIEISGKVLFGWYMQKS